MPGAEYLSPDRVQLTGELNTSVAHQLADDRSVKTIQFSEPKTARTFRILNDEVLCRRNDIEIRAFGFYGTVCDISFARLLPNVQRLSLDCLMEAQFVDCVCELEYLRALGVGIFELKSFEFLNDIQPQLEELNLGATRSKKPDLSPLHRFCKLRELYIEGQSKNIEVLSHLTNLEDVTLRSITTKDISYLTPLTKMWSLDVKLGGIRDLSLAGSMPGIKYLELWQVMGLADIGFISTMIGLQNLHLQSLSRVSIMPDLRALSALRRIYLDNMKGLTDISSLEHAPALEEFIHVSASNMNLSDYEPLLRNPSLRRASAGFGSDKRNCEFEAILRAKQIEEFEFSPFAYQ